jgi:hypothetical protein
MLEVELDAHAVYELLKILDGQIISYPLDDLRLTLQEALDNYAEQQYILKTTY